MLPGYGGDLAFPTIFLFRTIFDLTTNVLSVEHDFDHNKEVFLVSYSKLGSIPHEVIDSSDRVGTYLYQLAWR